MNNVSRVYCLILFIYVNIIVIYSQPQNLYYFTSNDVAFGTKPILSVIDIASGKVINTVSSIGDYYKSGTVVSTFNSKLVENSLILFGYKRITGSTFDISLDYLNVETFNLTNIGVIKQSPLMDLWDPSPSFGLDESNLIVYSLFTDEYQMNITSYDFKKHQFSTIYVPPIDEEPLNFQPSGIFDDSTQTYYINFYNADSQLEIMSFNVLTKEANYSHIYADYPHDPITQILYVDGNLYGTFNPSNTETFLYKVHSNNNTLELICGVPDQDTFGETIVTSNQNFIVFFTHLSKSTLKLTLVDANNSKMSSVNVPATSLPPKGYPLPTPVAAIL